MSVSAYIVLILVVLSTAAAVIALIWNLVNNQGRISFAHFFVMIFCPVVGPLFYLGAYMIHRLMTREREIAYADISFDSSRHEKKQMGNFLEEVDILPLEEAFKVSSKSDRRRALLTTLKKDYSKNISTIFLGLNNEDSETSHYAATVVMSAATDYLNMLTKLREEYLNENSEDQTTAAKQYLAGLKEFMQSDIMDSVDKGKYIRIHTEVMDWMYKHARSDILLDDYVFQIELLTESGEMETAEVWSVRAIQGYQDEDAVYYVTMRMYYRFGMNEKFLTMLNEIMTSNINISNETLQTIRFFTYK